MDLRWPEDKSSTGGSRTGDFETEDNLKNVQQKFEDKNTFLDGRPTFSPWQLPHVL